MGRGGVEDIGRAYDLSQTTFGADDPFRLAISDMWEIVRPKLQRIETSSRALPTAGEKAAAKTESGQDSSNVSLPQP